MSDNQGNDYGCVQKCPIYPYMVQYLRGKLFIVMSKP